MSEEKRIYKYFGTLIGDNRVNDLVDKVNDLENKKLNIATSTDIGGIIAEPIDDEHIEEIKIDPTTGKLYSRKYPEALTYKGTKENYADLPTDAKAGDMYNVINEYVDPITNEIHPSGTDYAWDGESWNALGGKLDLSIFLTHDEFNNSIAELEEHISSTGHELALANGDLSLLDEHGKEVSKVSLPNSIKHSVFTNTDGSSTSSTTKEDSWTTSDIDTSLAIKHSDDNGFAVISVSKNYAEIKASDTTDSLNNTKISVSSDNIMLTSEAINDNKRNTLIITPENVTLNGSEIITSKGGTFQSKPLIYSSDQASYAVTENEMYKYVANQLSNNLPKWNTSAPADTSKVLLTKVTIVHADCLSNLKDKSVLVKGYANNGFTNQTIAYTKTTNDVELPGAFIGSLTSTASQGIFVAPGSTITYVNDSGSTIVNTFTYEYLY
nr:MAG TPA: hypothetical protein [Caudoviricetes sp.]